MRISIGNIIFRDQSRMIVGKDDDQQKENEESEEEEPGTGSAGTRDRAPTVDLEVVNDQSKPEKMKNIHRLVSCWKVGLFLLNFAMPEQPRYSVYLETLKS